MINPYVWVCFGLFVVLLLLEVPIPFGMIAASILYSVLNGQSLTLLPIKIATSYSDWSMLAVPAFLFVGTFMNEIGLTDRIFGMAEAWLGRIPGGLAHANVLASMLFAGMSGSALADAGGLGVIEVHAMKEAGYDEDFSVAVTAASSTIGPIIPPSINLVIWGWLSATSTVTLFEAGLVPGIVMGLLMMACVVVMVKVFKIKAPRGSSYTFSQKMSATWRALPALGGPTILILGIMTGAFTPTECGVVAAVYCVALAACYRKLSIQMVRRALHATVSSAAMVMGLCATGLVFNWMIVSSGLITFISNALLMLGSEVLVLLTLNLLLLFMGCFIGSMQVLLMVGPLLISVADALGMTYIQIGVMAVFNLVIGLITPPMAPSLFVTAKATNTSFQGALKYTCIFIIPLVMTLLLITFWPGFTLGLPRLLGAMV